MMGIGARTWWLLDRWSPALFYAAGVLMLAQVVLIGLGRYAGGAVSGLWAAPPGIAAFVAGLVGLVGRYPLLARAGVAAALVAGGVLGAAAAWLVGTRLVGGGIPEPLPGWFMVTIGAFMVAVVLAFVNAAASLWTGGSSRLVGYLLLVPVAAWGTMFVVGAVTSFESALMMALYTNGVVSIALLTIGYCLRTRGTPTSALSQPGLDGRQGERHGRLYGTNEPMTNLRPTMPQMMKTFPVAAMLMMLVAAPVRAQPDPMIASTQAAARYVQDMLIQAADQMSEADYAFRPTPEVRSFGQLLAHVAETNYAFCSTAKGEPSPVRDVEQTQTTRPGIRNALAESFAYCDDVYAGLTDDRAKAMVDFMGQSMPVLAVLTYRTHHSLLHYGNVITYMRLRGKVPPSTQTPPGE